MISTHTTQQNHTQFLQPTKMQPNMSAFTLVYCTFNYNRTPLPTWYKGPSPQETKVAEYSKMRRWRIATLDQPSETIGVLPILSQVQE